jgi:hypothetical protein
MINSSLFQICAAEMTAQMVDSEYGDIPPEPQSSCRIDPDNQ